MASQKENKDKQDVAQDKDKQHKTAHKSATNTKDDGANGQELDSLLSVFEGDLSAIDSDTALSQLDEWHKVLHKAKEPELEELASSLKELKQLLKGGKATGHDIAEVLIEIGEQTHNYAAESGKELKTPLQKLSKQISKAGTSLSKAEDQEHAQRIESLVEALEGDLTTIDAEQAIGQIDEWYALLHKSEDESLKEIANGLKELKQLLKRSKAKGSDIGEVLTKIGEQTTESSIVAGRGLKGRIQRLGKQLSKAGKSLEQ